ncbi:Type I restriction-modification system, DNA methylase subunit [Actinomadura mexicana]|uniref:Type I restriction-modification system, DNA methylase subunit n=1 Tax=Actinomadura mexicana TaxID=134959 RepID=A0A238UT81_9ACTN|nr:Type I restriction-modification system, DNA methylase subunit [Actinomadura mexicana]
MLVSAAEIARLTGLGRAAVSNWRRRYEDFPQPAGGTANSPLFALPDIESWLTGQGRPLKLTPEERLWQLLRTTTDDLRLGELVGDLGLDVYFQDGAGTAVPENLLAAARELRERRGPGTFEYLVRRLVEAHARRIVPTPVATARLMAGLVRVTGRTVYDPACGLGDLLITARDGGATGLAGQDRQAYGVGITRTRLHIHGAGDAQVLLGDSLTRDRFPDGRFDVALCDPPFGDRAWGYDELSGDARWIHGLPPRGESELAWIQHVLWHLRPGGEGAVLMPPAAAHRRSGRRIRAALLRTGTLRAVLGLPAGAAAGSPAAPHLWLLRRPADGDPLPTRVLALDAADEDPDAAVSRYTRFLDDPSDESGPGRAVPLIDLLDDEVDLTPARLLRDGAGILAGYEEARGRLRERLAETNALAGRLTPLVGSGGQSGTTLGELIQGGAVEPLSPPLTMELGEGDVPVLTGKDIIVGRGPSARTVHADGLLILRSGDVAVAQTGRRIDPRVIDAGGAAAGPQVQVFRPDTSRCDPHFLACFLRAAGLTGGSSASSRADLRRTRMPVLAVEEQRAHGAAYRRLAELSTAMRDLADAADQTVALGIEGLGGGGLCPGG